MKLKFLTILLLFLFFYKKINANNFSKGDTLNVWAVNGLNLRTGPDLDFPISKKLKYGEKVKVSDLLNDQYRMSIKLIDREGTDKDFEIKGNWIKVRSVNKEKVEGYIFDGYLSRLPTLQLQERKKKRKWNENWEAEPFYHFAKENFGIKKEIKRDTKTGISKVTFQNEIFIQNWSMECRSKLIYIPNISFNEAYLLFNLMYQIEKKEQIYSTLEDDGSFVIRVAKEGNQYVGLSIGIDGGAAFSISFRDGKMMISESHCC